MNISETLESELLEFIQNEMVQDHAHDINHLMRVVKSAKSLATNEQAKLEVVLPAAYLHDCFSFPKNHPDRRNSSKLAADKAIAFLSSINYPSFYFDDIHHAITAHSFSANINPETIEAQIVQDADRLDALGAIGISRCIQVGASLGIRFYNPEDAFCKHRQPDDRCYTIDHFYIKLLKLANKMNTQSAKREAESRIELMQAYLQQLQKEI